MSCILRALYINSKLSRNAFTQQLQRCITSKLLNTSKPEYILINSYRYISTGNNSEKLEKIYAGPAAKTILYLKLFSFSGSACALAFLYFIFARSNLAMGQKYIYLGFSSISFVLTAVAQIIFRKYVVNMYYNSAKDNYVAVIYNFFGFKKYITFTPEDVESIDFEIMSTVKIKGQPMFFDSNLFSSVDHYKRILGYDKPIDFGEEFASMLKSKASDEKKS